MKLRHFVLFALTGLVGTCIVPAAPAPPPQPWVRGWNKPVDPDKDCKFMRSGEMMTIEVPGKVHFLSRDSTRRNNAPRLLRDVEGDFVVQVQVEGDFEPSSLSAIDDMPFIEGGMVLMAGEDVLACLARGIRQMGTSTDKYAIIRVRSPRNPSLYGVTELQKYNYSYLRLERKDNHLHAFVSFNGTDWRDVSPPLDAELPAKLKLGVFAASASKERFKPSFDHFKLTLPGKQGR